MDSGKLRIENSQIYSHEGIEYNTTYANDNLIIKNIVSQTDNTEISVNRNAIIEMIKIAKGVKRKVVNYKLSCYAGYLIV